MKTADAKASDMAAAQSGAAQMRYAAETHPAASAAETHHPAAASTAQMHSAASEVETTTTAAPEVSTATAPEVSTAASAAAEGLRSQWRHNGRQGRQQDCANHESVIFHEYLPELHRNVSRLGPSTGAQ